MMSARGDVVISPEGPYPPPRYPFPSRISPFAEQMRADTHRWYEEDFGWLPGAVRAKYRCMALEMSVARMLPDIPFPELMRPCNRMLIWPTLLDDYLDDCTPAQGTPVLQRVVDVLSGGQAPADVPEAGLYRNIAATRDELTAVMPAQWMHRFVAENILWFDAVQTEQQYTGAGEFVGDMEEFLSLREDSVGVATLFPLVEIETGDVLSDKTNELPVVRRAQSLTARIIAWQNDLLSLPKEIGRPSETMNLVLFLHHRHQLSLPEAYQRALRLHDSDVRELQAISQSPPDLGPDTGPVLRYIRYLGVLVAGLGMWYQVDTTRYAPGGYARGGYARANDRGGTSRTPSPAPLNDSLIDYLDASVAARIRAIRSQRSGRD